MLQKLLPLLDGNVAMAVVPNMLAPRLLRRLAVDLSPIETSLMKMRGDLAGHAGPESRNRTAVLKRMTISLKR